MTQRKARRPAALSYASAEPEAGAEAAGPGRLPDFVIIGAMKAATSSLGWYLHAHPEAGCESEPHFFCCHYGRGVEWYKHQFTDTGVRLIGEKTPHYLHSPEAIERMASVIPAAKLIVLLRDPVDRTLSHYWHERRLDREELELADALAAEPERIAGGDANYGYVERSRYLPRLKQVAALFPRDALHVVLFEDLRDLPADTFVDTCRFLGIDDTIVPPVVGETQNAYREHRPEWLWRFMFRYRLWRRLPKRAAHALGRWMSREAEYPPMEPATRRALASTFAQENEELARWLGRDLSGWTKP